MGCGGSKDTTKKPPEPATNAKPEAVFLRLVNNANHPVARRIMEEWCIFVDAHTQRLSGLEQTALNNMLKRPTEVWGTTGIERCAHQEIDDVGKAFMGFLKFDLTSRGWGGEFEYSVMGIQGQGYLNVRVDTLFDAAGKDKATFERKVNYICP